MAGEGLCPPPARRTEEAGQPAYSYSSKPSFKVCRQKVETELVDPLHRGRYARWEEILRHKLESGARETADYLRVALEAAGRAESGRAELARGGYGAKG